MPHKTSERNVNTSDKVGPDGARRMPHERDESPDDQGKAARGVMQQAADDLAQGLVDTDLHGQRGVEQVAPKPAVPGQARPHPDGADGMRHPSSPTPPKNRKQ